MTEPPVIAEAKSRKRLVFVSVVLIALATVVLIGVVGFLLLFSIRKPSLTSSQKGPPSSFLNVSESEVPGRYKWTDGASESFIVLYDDHTFMNRDGTTFAQYRWDLGADGLTIHWLNSSSRFTNIEAAGIYMTVSPKGIARVEKLPSYTASQVVPPKPVASILLGGQCATNGLMPVNSGSDGKIVRGKIGETDCYKLVRHDNRPAGYLYLQIAPELKTPPFTNALVMVEYFDAAPPDLAPGRLTVQYDAQHGVYANVQPLNLNGSDSWQEATFYLPRPVFQGQEKCRGGFPGLFE